MEEKKIRKNRYLLRRITPVEKMFFIQNLAVLLHAGFSLSKGLRTIGKQTKRPWVKEVIDTLAIRIEEGKTFADALREFEKLFDPLFINMIESGEVSGKLEKTLTELAIQLKKSHLLYLKVRNALAYPLIILFGMMSIGIGMMIFVIPNIVSIYENASQKLPAVTRGVIAVSNFTINHGLITALIVVTVGIITVLLYKQQPIRQRMHRLFLHIPILGSIIQEFNIARFYRVFHSLISTDIPIVRAFEVISTTLKNLAYTNFLEKNIPELEKGQSIGSVLEKDPVLFPATVIEMIIVAEESGSLEEMAKEIAEHYEEEVSSTLDGLSVLIEPLLMMVLGVGVGIIAVAVLWPMYNLVNVL